MFSYFEANIDGIIPNEYSSLSEMFSQLGCWLISMKDLFMLTARRFWINQVNKEPSKRQRRSLSQSSTRKNKGLSTGAGEKLRRSMIDLSNPSPDADPLYEKATLNDGPKKEN